MRLWQVMNFPVSAENVKDSGESRFEYIEHKRQSIKCKMCQFQKVNFLFKQKRKEKTQLEYNNSCYLARW